MPSKIPTNILRAKSYLPHDEIDALTDSEAWQLWYFIRMANDKRLQVCFSGFKAVKKAELIQLAHDNDFNVMASISKALYFLVCGDTVGPAKRKKPSCRVFSF